MNITEEALTSIRHYVWSGFYESEEIVEILCEEVFEPGELDEDWVREQLDSEFARKHLEEATWTSPTDCDRLDQAFAELEAMHIIALQNAGFTQSEAWEMFPKLGMPQANKTQTLSVTASTMGRT